MKKKIIKLTESDLYRIIKESVQTILQNNDNENDFDINSIDISDIDIEILKQSYIDLRLVPTRISYDDPLSKFNNINEAEGDIMSPDNVVNAIIQKYHLNPQLVIKVEASNKIYIYIVTACIGHNDKLIEGDMKKMGYFLDFPEENNVFSPTAMQFCTKNCRACNARPYDINAAINWNLKLFGGRLL